MELESGRSYEHMYLVFVDASGHSSVVRSNPRDRSNEAFNLLEQKVRARFAQVARHNRCEYVEAWGWQGDGGLFMVWDQDQSKSSSTAIEVAQSLLALDLKHARDEFCELGIRGELHLRVSVHQGTITYSGDDRRGSIHSPDLNFAAHLEKAAPSDCLAVSQEVYDGMPSGQGEFHAVGAFEGIAIFLFSPGMSAPDAQRLWIAANGIPRSRRIAGLYQRPSQQEKAAFISVATTEVLDLGTALRTCANYLVSGDRPRPYRDAVTTLLTNGVVYRCVLYTGSSNRSAANPLDSSEDLVTKAAESLTKLKRFKGQIEATMGECFQVWGSNHFPGLAALCVDPGAARALILYSPYLPPTPTASGPAERGDMPHYLVTPNDGELFDAMNTFVSAFAHNGSLERLL